LLAISYMVAIAVHLAIARLCRVQKAHVSAYI